LSRLSLSIDYKEKVTMSTSKSPFDWTSGILLLFGFAVITLSAIRNAKWHGSEAMGEISGAAGLFLILLAKLLRHWQVGIWNYVGILGAILCVVSIAFILAVVIGTGKDHSNGRP
jgi:hypothetical protein